MFFKIFTELYLIISQDLARKIILNRQLLLTLNAKDPLQQTEVIFKHLGYIQIDTINVVKRAHHHSLWTRCRDYKESILHELQINKKIFEYWGHAASYLPMSDYRYYLPTMKRFEDPVDRWTADIIKEHGHLEDMIMYRIRSEGPLSSSDFKNDPGKESQGWWDWNPVKKVLELLFWQGKLMVKERNNFRKYYDLTERVLPEDFDFTFPDRCELGKFLILKAINSSDELSFI